MSERGITNAGGGTMSPRATSLRVLVAILVPLAAALLVGLLTGALAGDEEPGFQTIAAPIFGALGIAGLLIGVRYYRLRALGLRGGRPFFAGVGFAVLGWVALLIGRFFPGLPSVTYAPDGQAVVTVALLIETVAVRSAGAGRVFFYLLFFEAFATQLWAYGLVFRALADWRGPLTAAVGSGILFGLTGYVLFQESVVPGAPVIVYFLVWGILYGIIRLRTGSILGPVLVQALQTFTAWFVFQPPDNLSATGIRMAYLIVSALYLIIIWRLWPRQASDYRV